MKWIYLVLGGVISYGHCHGFLPVDNVDPFTGDKYEKIEIGKVYKSRSLRNHYLNRTITLYNVVQSENRLYDAPSIHESCHDFGENFAGWSYSKSIERSVNIGIGFSLLGFDFGSEGSIARSVEFAIERWVVPTLGVEAVHTPFVKYKTYQGRSYLQQVRIGDGKSYNISLESPEFYIDYLEPVILVKRDVISKCSI